MLFTKEIAANPPAPDENASGVASLWGPQLVGQEDGRERVVRGCDGF